MASPMDLEVLRISVTVKSEDCDVHFDLLADRMTCQIWKIAYARRYPSCLTRYIPRPDLYARRSRRRLLPLRTLPETQMCTR